MTFQDIFKSSFLESFSSFSLTDTLLSLAAAFLIGLFIYFVYRKTYSGVLYSRSFNVSLIAILLVTCLVIQGVTSNVVLSLGMVGALSIVRFNWRRYPLRRFFAASGNSGMPYHRYFPAGILQPSAGRQPLPAHHPHGQRGRGKDSDNLCTAGSETDDSEVQDHYWRTGDRIDF